MVPSSPRRRRVLFAAAAVPLVALAFVHARAYAWLCDDAFISFRYARNLAQGHGLVYNLGERVEGYTNFAWVLELAALDLLGVAPPTASFWLSALVTAGVLALAARSALDPLGLPGGSGTPAERDAADPGRWLRAWAVLLFLAAHRGFAIWSTGGLETRQFTLLALAGWAALARGRPVLAGLALAACELTRPEGTLLFGVALAYLVATRALERRATLRPAVALAAPFLLIVAAHYLARRGYYGEWLPNTYHAKHVRPWPEMGLRYFAAAAIEHGLPLLLPAAALGALGRWALARDARHVLGLAWVGAHWSYLVWIGGDYFDFRPLDLHWPFLALAAADGIALAALGAGRLARRALPGHEPAAALGAGVLLAAAVGVYANAVQLARGVVTYPHLESEESLPLSTPLGEGAFPAAALVPGLERWIDAYDRAIDECKHHGVALPWIRLTRFAREQQRDWSGYGELDLDALLPRSAVVSVGAAGIGPYFWGRLTVIDRFGLTDAHVARLPVERRNDQRYMAHDRQVDSEYLRERGVNLRLFPLADTAAAALARGSFVLRVDEETWLPFDTNDPDWVRAEFPPGVHVGELVEVLGSFEEDLDGWTSKGDAFADGARRPLPRPDPWQSTWRFRGAGVDSAAHGRRASGALRSPPFLARAGTVLEFRLGGDGPRVGVELRDGTRVLESWRPSTASAQRNAVDLTPWAGRTLRLRLFDDTDNRRATVCADDFVVLAPVPLDGP